MSKLCLRYLPVIIASALAAIPSFAYNDHRGINLDSLERVVAPWTPDATDKASTEDLLRLNRAYRNLMLGYSSLNSEKCSFYARKALSISEAEGWPFASQDAYRYLGLGFYGHEQYDSALVYFNKALAAVDLMASGATSPTSPDGYGEDELDDAYSALYGTIGNLYNMLDSIPKAMEYYARAGELFDKHGWNESNAVLHYNIGETWVDEGDFKAAEKAYRKSLDYALAANDSLMTAWAQKGMGRLYMEMGHTWKALRYLNMADTYYAAHDLEESIPRKEVYEYMSKALEAQRRQLGWMLAGAVVLLLLLAGMLLLSHKLRSTRKVQEKTAVVMQEALEDLQQSHPGPVSVSEKEKTILDLLSKGYTTPQIAECISLSPETIKWYRKKLLVKYDAANTAELISKAKEN